MASYHTLGKLYETRNLKELRKQADAYSLDAVEKINDSFAVGYIVVALQLQAWVSLWERYGFDKSDDYLHYISDLMPVSLQQDIDEYLNYDLESLHQRPLYVNIPYDKFVREFRNTQKLPWCSEDPEYYLIGSFNFKTHLSELWLVMWTLLLHFEEFDLQNRSFKKLCRAITTLKLYGSCLKMLHNNLIWNVTDTTQNTVIQRISEKPRVRCGYSLLLEISDYFKVRSQLFIQFANNDIRVDFKDEHRFSPEIIRECSREARRDYRLNTPDVMQLNKLVLLWRRYKQDDLYIPLILTLIKHILEYVYALTNSEKEEYLNTEEVLHLEQDIPYSIEGICFLTAISNVLEIKFSSHMMGLSELEHTVYVFILSVFKQNSGVFELNNALGLNIYNSLCTFFNINHMFAVAGNCDADDLPIF